MIIEKNLDWIYAFSCSSIQKKKEALEVKRLELEVRHWEMKNEQLAMHWKLTQEKMEK